MNRAMISALLLAALTQPVVMAKGMTRDDDYVFVDHKAVRDKPDAQLDPAKAYLMYRLNGISPLYLIKEPTEADLAEYARLRGEALAEAQEDYPKDRTRYERRLQRWNLNPVGDPPEEPVEPTDENFEFTPIEQLEMFSIGPLNRFAKNTVSVYLEELPPGTYRIYGLLRQPNGDARPGLCFCMGSVRFEVRAGEVTDLGFLDMPALNAMQDPTDHETPLRVFGSLPEGVDLDSRIVASGLPLRAADLHPAGKLPNYFGVATYRIPAIPGVIAYDRDRIIDLTAKQ
ncbi:MAG: hypothetical protein CMN73_11450 [Sphingomonas sp.]|nr:hypothetical protein [Sphingomonas sp.]